jgi:hypothetical protein
MYISDNYINSKKIATENYNNYVAAKPFPIIVFDNLFEEDILNLILNYFPKNIQESGSKFDNKAEKKLGLHSTIFRQVPGTQDVDGNLEFKKLFGKIYLKSEKNFSIFWSGQRGSNPRPSRWQRDALPLSYARIIKDYN